MISSRRTFFIRSLTTASGLAALATANTAHAQAPTAVLETSEQAQAIGYKTDSTKVDSKKHPNHASNQSCVTCVLFQGNPGEAVGGCAVFGNNLVASTGWCGAWTKKG